MTQSKRNRTKVHPIPTSTKNEWENRSARGKTNKISQTQLVPNSENVKGIADLGLRKKDTKSILTRTQANTTERLKTPG